MADPGTATDADPDPFVGRGTELAALRTWMREARAGDGSLVLVGGPAGIGKTRTVEEATRTAPAVVWGRCVDDPGAPPLWPWRRVLRARPEVGAAAAEALTEVDLLRERGADPEAARFRFVAAASEALLAAAEPDGLVLVLEDLHWADETSLRLLRHLAGDLHRSRLLVVATHRDPGGPADGRLDRTLPELLRWPGTRTLHLPPLTEDDVRDYLAAVAAPPAGTVAARALHRRSGGNPLYLRAIARGPGVPEDSGTPAGTELRHVIRSTLAALDRPVADLLATAAVLGEEVEPELLAAVAARPVADVRADLDAAVRAGVLVAAPDAPGRRRFLHAVVRDGVYADLWPSAREALHRRAAEAWESVGTNDATAGVVAAHWLRAAADPATSRRAASWARRASVAATRALAFDEAARFVGMALDAADRAGCGPGERAALLVELATAEFRTGRSAEALEHAVAASEAAAGGDREDLLAEAALVVHDVAAPEFPPALLRLCERALAAPGVARSPVLRSRLLSQTASALADAGRLAGATERSAEALRLAEDSGDPEAVLDAVRARMKASPGALHPAERMRLGLLAVEHGGTTGQPLMTLWGHKWRIDAALGTGDMVTVHDELARVSLLARGTRLPLVRWHDLRLRASVAALLGRFPEALRLNDEARDIALSDLSQDLTAAGMSLAFVVQHGLVTGDHGTWDDAAHAPLDRAGEAPIVLVTRALVSLLRERDDEAAARYEQLRPLVADPDFTTSPGVVVNLVPLVERFGDAATAEVAGALIAQHPIAAGGAGVYGFGSVHVLLGRLAVVRGDLDEAIGNFEQALAVDTGTGARPAVVHDRIGLARALLDRAAPGDHVRAGMLLRQAVEEARRLGMPGPLRTASSIADRLAAANRAADPLTAREREITALVAQALTNRQIAERLFLSERTVESHVRNILAKLGLANRTELATVTRAAGR